MTLATYLPESAAYASNSGFLDTDLEPLPKPSAPDEWELFLRPKKIFTNIFKKIEWGGSEGSSFGYVPIIDRGTPNYYCSPESTRTGQYSMFESGEPMRDALYRGSTLTLFQPLKNGDQLYAEFYSRKFQYPYHMDIESAPQEVKMKGINVGIKF